MWNCFLYVLTPGQTPIINVLSRSPMLMDLLHGFNVPAQDSDNALFSPSATMTTHHPSDRDRL